MRKQLFTNPFLLLFGCLAIIVALLYQNHQQRNNIETVSMDCPKKMEVLEGTGLLWESLSKQFVQSYVFN